MPLRDRPRENEDFPQVAGQIQENHESEPKCVIQGCGGPLLQSGDPLRRSLGKPPSAAFPGNRIWRDLSWVLLCPDRGAPGRHTALGTRPGNPAGPPTPGCISLFQSPNALPETQGRSGSGYLMNRMLTWRLRSSRKPLGAESTWRPKTRRFDSPLFLELAPLPPRGVAPGRHALDERGSGAYRGERLRSLGCCPHDMAFLAGADGSRG